ncbi:HAD family hydrolase [Faecalispora anaeroviscerum]|uniref:HAD family hydrolase n=1 Tax=Faecalispora anaeroviscerum TaxID=2991836 RepID=UPI0024B8CE66|nr:HAD family phosphatase [Faecalispora anaeroviscerum]
MKQFQGAVFDLDGTLLDSMGVWAQIDRDSLGRRGIPVPEDYAKAVALLGFWASAEYTIRRFQLPDTPQQLTEEWNRMAQDAYRFRVELKPGAKEYLSYLREQGVPLAVATSSYRELFVPTLERHGILDWFDAVVTVSEVSRGKGFPDIYEEAARRMERRPQECAVFEDLPGALRGARDGGFYTVGVYDPHSKEEETLMRQMSDRYIRDFRELLE